MAFQGHPRLAAAALAIVLALAALFAPTASADPGTDTTALRDAVTADGVLAHEQAFQEIADANGGTRAAGTPGYEASGVYVEDLLEQAGYLVSRQEFSYEQFLLNSSAFEQTAPTPTTYVADTDYAPMSYSGSGDVTAPVQAVDINLAGDRASTSGCEAEDFAGFTAGNIALLQRGTCPFRVKVDNAAAAGAAAAIVFNQGNEDPGDDRFGLLFGTLDPPEAAIPAIGTPFELGASLASTAGLEVRVAVDATLETTTSFNVLADTPTGRADRTVVVGAHLDSVAEGPGINDNGSGSAAILETALQIAELDVQPRNRVRFAFWGGEEDGLIGSDHYVAQLSSQEIRHHAVNLNFDMVGSPNFARFVYDGDGDAFGTAGPNGSDRVEDVFNDYFASQGLATAPTEFDGRSDYFAFINNGIPAGGLFTGAEGIKTAEEAALFGGTAGAPYDPCYHQACDTMANLSTTALDEMSDAVAHATLTFAQTRSAVNGTAQGNAAAGAALQLTHRGNQAFA
jgi:Zn-dependent M28 family amino/carboxypeptidase